jgi:hypothetical protein
MPKPIPTFRRRPTPHACVACKCDLGQGFGVLPMRVAEDNGEGGGAVESWCPQDFVYVRAARDPRWGYAARAGLLTPVTCTACGVTSVAVGHLASCGQCGSRVLLVLPPKIARGAA